MSATASPVLRQSAPVMVADSATRLGTALLQPNLCCSRAPDHCSVICSAHDAERCDTERHSRRCCASRCPLRQQTARHSRLAHDRKGVMRASSELSGRPHFSEPPAARNHFSEPLLHLDCASTASRLRLDCISIPSRQHFDCISTTSQLHLNSVSIVSRRHLASI